MARMYRDAITVGENRLSLLRSGEAGTAALLLHGTFWSRVWQPVLPALGEVSQAVAVDLPGFGCSDGELDIQQATVPALADVAFSVADALGFDRFAVIGHDIGGGIAQHMAVAGSGRVDRLALVNSVLLDSWPVPAVKRFRDPDVRAATTPSDLLAARRKSLVNAVARRLSEDDIEDYLTPWHDPARAKSWMAMAAAADARYTLDLVDRLREWAGPMRLIWGEDDMFQRVEFAERFAHLLPTSTLVRVPGRHIPQEDSPRQVADALVAFLTA
jgi:pimeloyl-ACP methyl ester carboxylesterase